QNPNSGQGGNLTVIAEEFVEVSGVSPDGKNLSVLSTATSGQGNAGDLEIQTGRLTVKNRAIVAASTAGEGKGGNLIINADFVELLGIAGSLLLPSGLSTDTIGEGDAGNLIINTRRFVARDGAVASVSTFSEGEGGNLIVNAQSVELIGTATNGLPSGLYAQAFGNGDAGDLIVNTEYLTIQNNAQITVAAGNAANINLPNATETVFGNITLPTLPNKANGNAGDAKITADSILLNNQGAIIAQTESSEGGNIDLFVNCLLLLRNNSQISTTAGTAQAGGNGGNITIDAPNGFIIAIPSENSDITANAFEGDGGRVDITTQGILGLEFRDHTTSLSDITASSERGLDGEVNINLTVETEPEQGLTNPPNEPVDVELIEGCQVGRGGESAQFSYVGEGGSPPASEDISDTSVSPWLPLTSSENDSEPEVSGDSADVDEDVEEDNTASQSPKSKKVIITQELVTSEIPTPICQQ
ncbi:MAG: S-layer family protein, partial [Symploca sp. SIO2G7]|nr:S-layer family protein [Symploca sp. SIO2G7]